MKAGRELDALVAERVMNFTICEHSRKGIGTAQSGGTAMCGDRLCKGVLHYDFLPNYSTDIAQAYGAFYNALERLHFCSWSIYGFSEGDGWRVCVGYGNPRIEVFVKGSEYRETLQGEGPYAPMPYVLCLAALKAVGVEVEA